GHIRWPGRDRRVLFAGNAGISAGGTQSADQSGAWRGTRAVSAVHSCAGMVLAWVATVSMGRPGTPHRLTMAPTVMSGYWLRSMVSVSIDTRPTIGAGRSAAITIPPPDRPRG